MKQNYIIVCYYTRNTGYEHEVKNLVSSLDMLKLDYDIHALDTLGDRLTHLYDPVSKKGRDIIGETDLSRLEIFKNWLVKDEMRKLYKQKGGQTFDLSNKLFNNLETFVKQGHISPKEAELLKYGLNPVMKVQDYLYDYVDDSLRAVKELNTFNITELEYVHGIFRKNLKDFAKANRLNTTFAKIMSTEGLNPYMDQVTLTGMIGNSHTINMVRMAPSGDPITRGMNFLNDGKGLTEITQALKDSMPGHKQADIIGQFNSPPTISKSLSNMILRRFANMGEAFGLGINNYYHTDPKSIMKTMILKRAAPIAALGYGYNILDNTIDILPMFNGTALDEGISVAAAEQAGITRYRMAQFHENMGITKLSQ